MVGEETSLHFDPLFIQRGPKKPVLLYTAKTNYYFGSKNYLLCNPQSMPTQNTALMCLLLCLVFGTKKEPTTTLVLILYDYNLYEECNSTHKIKYVWDKRQQAPTHFLIKEKPFSMLPANSFFAFSKPTLFQHSCGT